MRTMVSLMAVALCAIALAADPPTVTISQWARGKVGAVSMTFDDGGTGHATVVAPLLKEHGFRGTFFVVTNWLEDGKHMSWDQLREMAAAGQEIGSHTKSHGYGEGSEDALKGSRDRIDQEIPSQKCVTISYPSGGYNKEAPSYYIGGRMAGKHFFYPHWVVNLSKVEDYIVNGNTGEMDAVVKGCLEQKAWATLTYHMPGKDFATELDVLKASEDKLWVAPFGEVVRYCREARAAKITTTAEEKQLTLRVSDDLDDALYNYPLTLTFSTAWATATATCQGKPVWCEVRDGQVLVEVVPDGGDVVLTGA